MVIFEELDRQGKIASRRLAKVRTVYGDTCYVAWEDWQDARIRIQVPLRNRFGTKFSTIGKRYHPGATTIHRENVSSIYIIP